MCCYACRGEETQKIRKTWCVFSLTHLCLPLSLLFLFLSHPPDHHPVLPLCVRLCACASLCCFLVVFWSQNTLKGFVCVLKSLKVSSGAECPRTPRPDFHFVSCHLFHHPRVCRSGTCICIILLPWNTKFCYCKKINLVSFHGMFVELSGINDGHPVDVVSNDIN